MSRKPFLLVLVIVAGSLLDSGCKGDTNQAPSFTRDPGWAVENIDPTYWTRSGSASNATVFAGFWIDAGIPMGCRTSPTSR